MGNIEIASGVVHELPDDLSDFLKSENTTLALWNAITPLARNEWICWLEDAKKPETRSRRIDRVKSDLKVGKNRPCCWPGCSHRKKSGKPE